ncbi:MAG: hypothetical protein ACLFV7_02615 [Phycisphaerae bacterium]
MGKAIIGVFEGPREAAMAIDDLAARAVDKSRISALASEPTVKKTLGIDVQTKGAEGIAIGGGIGTAAGAILAGLTSVGVLATGGIGLVATGPLIAALTGAGAGALAGGALGGLIGLGFSEQEVKHFEDALEKGSAIIAVDMENHDDEDIIKDVFESHSAKETATA